MDHEHIDEEIRRALAVESERIEVPDDLAERTLEAAEDERPGRLERLRARRDARRAHAQVTGFPRWAYVGAAAAAMAFFFVIGLVVTDEFGVPDMPAAVPFAPEPGEREWQVEQDGIEPTRGVGGALTTGEGGAQEVVPDVEREAEAMADPVEPPMPRPEQEGVFPPQLIHTAQLEVEVEEGTFDVAWRDANEVAGRHQGFVTSSATEVHGDRLARGTLVARVPSEHLEAALRDFRELGTLASMTTEGTDVSGQLVDLDARLNSLRLEEAQLLELLERAQSVSDVLEVRQRLDEVRGEIERFEGRKAHLEQQVDFATIEASIFEPTTDGGGSGSDGRFADAWETAIGVASTIFAGFVVALGVIVPFALVGLLIALLVGLVRRQRA